MYRFPHLFELFFLPDKKEDLCQEPGNLCEHLDHRAYRYEVNSAQVPKKGGSPFLNLSINYHYLNLGITIS